MRVNCGRLSLDSLAVNVPCTITTGSTSIKLVHNGSSIDMGLYLRGVGMGALKDGGTWSAERGRNGRRTYWLHLDRLAPRRLYEVMVTGPGEGDGPPEWQLSDRTPDAESDVTDARSGGKSWGLLGRLLGGGGK